MQSEISFGYWLRLKRKAHDLTRLELSKRVKCSVETIRKIESEERRPSAQLVEILAEIFNIPQEEQKAFLRFARGDWQSAPLETHFKAPWQESSSSHKFQIPSATTSLVGRDAEVLQVRDYMLNEGIRLVTLIGPPGIGKTRLSLEVARTLTNNFPDGVVVVALASLEDPSLIISAILEALGLTESKTQPVNKQLYFEIGHKNMLLVLDNCEHLIEEVAQIVASLLSICPRIKMMLTSREALRISGEWLYPVPTLSLPQNLISFDPETIAQSSAVNLFVERARAVRFDFELNAENYQAVTSICTRLDGLPLALELIAARIQLLSPQMLLERMTDSFILSANRIRNTSTRQGTLKNAIGWSFQALSNDEQKIFSALAVFSGGFTLSAAETAFAKKCPGTCIQDLLTSLSDKSLIQRKENKQGEVRFYMLYTIQQFAMNILREAGEESVARNLHLGYFLELAETGDGEIRGPAQAEWGSLLEAENDNFIAALDWSFANQMTDSVLRLLSALGWAWEVHGHYHMARIWFEKVRNLPGANKYPADFARLLNHFGRLSWTREQYQDARHLLEEGQAVIEAMGNGWEGLLVENLNWLGLVSAIGEKNNREAVFLFNRALTISEKTSDLRGIALSTFHLGLVETDDSLALPLLEKSITLFEQFGDLFFIARTSLFIGHIFLRQRNFEKARTYFEQHLHLDLKISFWDGIADGFRHMGLLFREMGDYEQAEKYFEESAAICHAHGLVRNKASYLSGLLAFQKEDPLKAEEIFISMLYRAQEYQEKIDLGLILVGLAATAAKTSHPNRALILNTAARKILQDTGDIFPMEDFTLFERSIQQAFEQLDESEIEDCFARGNGLTPEQTIKYALKKNN